MPSVILKSAITSPYAATALNATIPWIGKPFGPRRNATRRRNMRTRTRTIAGQTLGTNCRDDTPYELFLKYVHVP